MFIKCIIVLVFLFPLIARETDYKIEQITHADGLSDDNISCIYQDKQGFIWIGTENGLNRYDGYTFKEYKYDPDDSTSISHNFIRTFFADPADSGKILWIGTKGGGLNKLDLETESFTRYMHNPGDSTSISHNAVKCIYKDSRDTLWIGTEGGGLNIFCRKTGTFTTIKNNPCDPYSFNSKNVSTICEDSSGYLWIGTVGNGLYCTALYNQEFSEAFLSKSDRHRFVSLAFPASETWQYLPNNSNSGVWKRRSDLPLACYAAGSCCLNNEIYHFGGASYSNEKNLMSVQVYDPEQDQWRQLPDMRFARAGLAAAVVDTMIYTVGGFESKTTWGSRADLVEIYFPEANQWLRKTKLAERRGDHCLAVIKDNLYMLGGIKNIAFTSSLNTVALYEPKTDTWVKKAPMLKRRTVFASAVWKGKIYVFGGQSSPGSFGMKNCEVYDPQVDRWMEISPMPESRWGHSAVTLNGKIIILGGVKDFYLQKSVFAYDPRTDSWERWPDMPAKRACMAANVVGGNIYCMGGTGFPVDQNYTDHPFVFHHFRYNQFDPYSIKSNSVFSLYADKTGRLWIGMSNGLCIFDRKTGRFFRHTFDKTPSKVLNSGLIWSMYQDQSKNLWILTHKKGIIKVNQRYDAFTNFTENSETSIGNNTLSCAMQDRSDIYWIGTYGSGINKLIPQKKNFQRLQLHISDPNNPNDNQITAVSQSSTGILWCGTARGVLYQYKKEQHTFEQYRFDTSSPILDIYNTDNGHLWLARGNALTKFNSITGRFVNYSGWWRSAFMYINKDVYDWLDKVVKQNKPVAAITRVGNNQNIYHDFTLSQKQELLIIAVGEGTHNMLRDKAWLTMGETAKPVWSMQFVYSRRARGSIRNRIQLAKLTLEAGTYRLHYQSDSAHAYGTWINEPPPRPELWGVSLYKMPESVPDIVYALINQKQESVNRLFINNLTDVLQDHRGKVWCIMNGLVYTFTDTLPEPRFDQQIISVNNTEIQSVHKIFLDNSGTLWFATENNGLIRQIGYKIENSDSTAFTYHQYRYRQNVVNCLNSNTITALFQDNTGIFWIGTDRGLNCFDPDKETFRQYTMKEGLPAERIHAIQADHNGKIWFATESELHQLDPENGRCNTYDRHDGLPGVSFNSDCLSSSGRLYFSGESGLIFFHPDSLSINNNMPNIVLTDFQLFNQSVIPGEDSPLIKSISASHEVRLAHNQNKISLEFAALEFTNPAQNRYQYKMEGVDPDWIHTGATRRYATYTQLAPGKYTFRVKGSNNDGIWNEKGFSLRIIITPPWYQTYWAYAIYLLLLFSLTYGAWRLQTNRLKMKHKLEIEQLHGEKLEEVDRMKSRFFANISHEFRTPLTLILGPLEKIISGEMKENLQDHYKLMRRNAKRLLQLINQLLDLSKLESGKLKLQAQATEIITLLKGLVQAFESLAVLKKIELRFDSDQEMLEAWIDRDKFETIINNLLSNAFKFTPEGGEIIVNLGVLISKIPSTRHALAVTSHDFVEISISNTGPGIPADRIDKIFDRFYQVNEAYTKDSDGTGIGLAITKELVELHHGGISVSCTECSGVACRATTKGNGFRTTFTIWLPIGKKHLKPEEIIEKMETGDRKQETGLPIPMESPEDVEVAFDRPPVSSLPTTVSYLQSPLLLIVEDNTDLRNYIANTMDPKFKIIEAEEGLNGFEKAVKTIPDLIISDVMMPGMDGFQLCHKIKNDERTSHIPFILLTARAGREDRLEGLETGADDYLAKPFDTEELQVRVKNLIEQRRKLRARYSREPNMAPQEIVTSSVDQSFIQKAIEIINNHLSEPEYTVERYVRDIGLSHMQLHRKLQALTGLSPSAFMRNIRLRQAAMLIRQREKTVSEIAFEVGFNNLSYFAKCFRQTFGCSPSSYGNQDS